MAIELGAYYVSVVPSMRGAAGQIQSQMSGIDMSKPGTTLGKQMSSSLVKGMDLQSVGARMQALGGSISNVGAKLTNSITKPAVVAGTAVATLVAGLGFKRLVGIDTARGQFKGLGYDADAVMKQVDAGVTNTSLSMAEGAAAAVSILATGAIPLEGLEAQIKRVANVSAAYGVDANQANYLLNNVLTKQKVTWGDLAQMQMNQIPIVTALADTFGYTGEEIQKMAENGEISIDMLNEALDNKAGSAAEAYAETWTGVTKNILSNLGKLGAKVLEPTFEIVKEKAADFLAYLKSPEFSEWAEVAGQKIAEFVTSAIELFDRLKTAWQGLSPETQKLIGKLALAALAAGPFLQVVGKLVSGSGRLVSGLGRMSGWLGRIAPAFSSTGSGAAGFIAKFGRVAGVIGLVVAALALLWTKSEAFREGVKTLATTVWEVATQIWEALSPIFKQLWDVISPVIVEIGDLLGGVLQQLTPVFQTLGDAFLDLVDAAQPFLNWLTNNLAAGLENIMTVVRVFAESLGPILEGMFTVITGIFNAWAALFRGDWSGLWEAVKQVFRGVWQVMSGMVSGAVAVIQTIVSGWLSTLSALWTNVWGSVSRFLASAWVTITTTVTVAIATVKSAISNALASIHATWTSTWNSVKSFFASIWTGIKTGAVAGVTAVYVTVTGIKSRIVGFFSGAGQWLVSAGRSIVQGLIDGIKAMAGSVTSAVSGVLEAARNLLPFSPAKTGPFSGKGWTLYSGMSIVEALADGVMAKEGAFTSAVSSVMRGGQSVIGDLHMGAGLASGGSGRLIAGDSPHFTVYVTNPFTGEEVEARMAKVAVAYG